MSVNLTDIVRTLSAAGIAWVADPATIAIFVVLAVMAVCLWRHRGQCQIKYHTSRYRYSPQAAVVLEPPWLMEDPGSPLSVFSSETDTRD